MKRKAIFLLMIFMLNTVVGFSCALHFDQHIHGNNHSLAKSVFHHQGHSHLSAYQMAHDVNPAKGLGFVHENLCCKTLTGNLAIQGKLSADSDSVLAKVPVLWIRSGFNPAPVVTVNALNVGYAKFTDPCFPNKDIRIAIRSFQI
jgi:hypothetical protein